MNKVTGVSNGFATAGADSFFTTTSNSPASRAPTKMYFIDCCGTGYVAIDNVRLDAMFEKMPTFKFLLVGHPHMKAKVFQKSDDGTEILKIPNELEVSKPSFILLIKCFFNTIPLPHPGLAVSRFEELIDTVATLGGCVTLEEQFKDLRCDPMIPEDDVHQEFYWANLPGYSCSPKAMVAMRENGYSWTKSVDVQYTGGSRTNHIFRAPKNPPVPTSHNQVAYNDGPPEEYDIEFEEIDAVPGMPNLPHPYCVFDHLFPINWLARNPFAPSPHNPYIPPGQNPYAPWNHM